MDELVAILRFVLKPFAQALFQALFGKLTGWF